MVLYNFAAIGLIATPIQFVLMNKLKFTPVQQAAFGMYTDIPFYVGFAFGFLRDRWRPFNKGDRAYFFFVPVLMAAVYVAMSFAPANYYSLLWGGIGISALSALLGASAQGLLAAIGKDFGMMGRLGTITLITARGSMMYSAGIGGWLGDNTGPRVPFLLSALVCLTVVLLAFWRPRTIFRSGDEVFVSVIPENAMAAIKRLLRHKAVYIPAIVLFLWEFSPGWGTPLMRYLTEHIKISESAFGSSQAALRFGTVFAGLSYGWLCKWFRFKALLNGGTFLGVLGAPAFLLIHNAGQANFISLLAGVSCGIALAAYYDLLIRCCPKELEGVAYMLTYAVFTFASDISDIFGSWLYQKGGFALALAVATVGTAFIFIPVNLLPRAISHPHEGEPIIDEDPPEPISAPLTSTGVG
jgi:MFS family permease